MNRLLLALRGSVIVLVSGCGACGGPTGPGDGAPGPSGKIYFQWIPEGRPQAWVYDFTTKERSRVPVWFPSSRYPHVDTAGMTMAFRAPTADLTTISLMDSTEIETWGSLGNERSYPRLSQDGRYVATHRQLAHSSEIYILDRVTGEDRLVATFDELSSARPVHWFAGGDSLLIVGFLGSGTQAYHVVQADGSRTNLFGFTPAYAANSLTISNDGSRIAFGGPVEPGQPRDSADPHVIVVYDLDRRTLLQEFTLPHHVGHLAWSPDKRFLAHAPSPILGRQSILEILDAVTGKRTVMVPDNTGGPSAQFPTWVR